MYPFLEKKIKIKQTFFPQQKTKFCWFLDQLWFEEEIFLNFSRNLFEMFDM